MFNLWQRVYEEGADVVRTHADELSALDWYEVEERYPELVPEVFKGQNPLANPEVRTDPPFGIFGEGDSVGATGAYSFRVSARGSDRGLWAYLSVVDLIAAFARKDDTWWDDVRVKGNAGCGILTCTCGCPGCAGLWEQRMHFSKLLVRISVREYDQRHDYFFSRSDFEKGVVRMLADMVENRTRYDESEMNRHADYDDFRKAVAELIEARSYLKDVWRDCVGETTKNAGHE